MPSGKQRAAGHKSWDTRRGSDEFHDEVTHRLFNERRTDMPTLEASAIDRPNLGTWLEYFLARNRREPKPPFAERHTTKSVDDSSVQSWLTDARKTRVLGNGDGPNALRWALRWLRLKHPTGPDKPMNPATFIDKCNEIVNELNGTAGKQIRQRYRDQLSETSTARRNFDDWPEVIQQFPNDWLLTTCRWRSWGRFPPEVVCVVVKYLYDAGLLRRGADARKLDSSEIDTLHEAVRAFLGIEPESHTSFARAVQGRYFLFRPSLHVPGAVLKSRLYIQADSINALVVTEDHEHLPDGDAAGFEERYIGLLWRKSSVPFMLMIRRFDKHEDPFEAVGVNNARGAARVSLLPHVIFDARDGKVAAMSGITVANVAGAHTLALPVCIERSRLDEKAWTDVPIGVAIPSDSQGSRNSNLQPHIPMSIAHRLRALDEQIGDRVNSINWPQR